MTPLGWAISTVAMTILLIAAAGIILLPDALARQHAATKAVTLALSLFALGLGLVAGNAAWTWRLVLLVAILLMTLPLASHAVARAGATELGLERDGDTNESGSVSGTQKRRSSRLGSD